MSKRNWLNTALNGSREIRQWGKIAIPLIAIGNELLIAEQKENEKKFGKNKEAIRLLNNDYKLFKEEEGFYVFKKRRSFGLGVLIFIFGSALIFIPSVVYALFGDSYKIVTKQGYKHNGKYYTGMKLVTRILVVVLYSIFVVVSVGISS